jgi:hypothetical protein
MVAAKPVGIALMLAVGLFLTAEASADQCSSAIATKDQWEAARKLVREAPSVLAFCPPCGERVPKRWAGRFENADLAYLYVQVSDDRYGNVARMVGCSASGVSAFIDAAGRPR